VIRVKQKTVFIYSLLWESGSGKYSILWHGGRTSLNGVESPATLQRNSRLGVTGSLPLARNQSIKMSYNRGNFISFGGKYQCLSVAWQYSWLGRPD